MAYNLSGHVAKGGFSGFGLAIVGLYPGPFKEAMGLGDYMSHSLNSLKGIYGGLYRGLLWGLLMGILGV